MTVLREFFAVLGLDTKDADFSKAEKALGNIKKAATVVVGAVTAVGAAFGVATKRATDNARLLERWNRITGESVTNLDAMRIAANRLGIDSKDAFESMSEIADRASDVLVNIGNLQEGIGEEFRALGFTSVTQLTDPETGGLKDATELLDDVLTRMAAIDNQTKRTGIAVRLFGGDLGLAIASLPLERFREFRQEALDLGLAMSEDQVKAATAFSLQLRRLSDQLDSLVDGAIIPALKPLTDFAGGLSISVQQNQELIQSIATPVFKAFVSVLEFVILTMRDYALAINFVVEETIGWRNVSKLMAATLGLFLARQVAVLAAVISTKLVLALAALRAMTLSYIATVVIAQLKTLLFGAGILILVAALDDLIKTFAGGETVFTRFRDALLKDIKPDDLALVKVLKLIVRLVDEVSKALVALPDAAFGEGSVQEIALEQMDRFAKFVKEGIGGFGVEPRDASERLEERKRELGITPGSLSSSVTPSAPSLPRSASPPSVIGGSSTTNVTVNEAKTPRETALAVERMLNKRENAQRREIGRQLATDGGSP